jgi:hypothetical protein
VKNNLFRPTLALLALCIVATLSAKDNPAPAHPSFGEISLNQVTVRIAANGDTVTTGTSRIMVLMRLGSPNTVLADGSWLYYGYSARLSPSGPNANGTLVVRFSDSVVTRLTLADKATVTALRQVPRQPGANQLLAVR